MLGSSDLSIKCSKANERKLDGVMYAVIHDNRAGEDERFDNKPSGTWVPGYARIALDLSAFMPQRSR